MIGGFPDPYPDELFYSVCARFHTRMRHRGQATTMKALFGKDARAIIELPSSLGHIVTELPPGHPYTVDRLMDQHTMLPFYAPFLPPERVQRLKEDMQGPNGGAIYGRIGILRTPLRLEFLRYCPLCVEADRQNVGEAYWHRRHQIPGVELCPVHAVFLEASDIRARQGGSMQGFLSAERTVQSVPIRPLDSSDPGHVCALRLAQEAAWLLDQCSTGTDLRIFQNRYIGLLFARGLATYTGVVKKRKLAQAFRSHYLPDFLTGLKLGMEHNDHWLFRLVYEVKKAQHPIRHLLLIHFLGCSVETFFQLPEKLEPFGEGPWPCLNPASDHFQQPTITECKISYRRPEPKRPVGLFRCNCGFSYYRTGPDTTGEARFQRTKIHSYGPVWEAALRDLCAHAECLPTEMGRRLGVCLTVFRKQVARLGLSGSPIDKEAEPSGSVRPVRPRRVSTVSPEKLEAFRNTWLQAVEENPGACRSAIAAKIRTVYYWLIVQDKAWFEAHAPQPQRVGSPGYIDWAARDAQLASAVRETVIRIRSAPGRPVRVCTTVIGRALGQLGILSKCQSKIPLTMTVLAEVVESIEAYAIRKIEWAAECFREENVRPSAYQLQIRARVSPKVAALPEATRTMVKAIQSLGGPVPRSVSDAHPSE